MIEDIFIDKKIMCKYKIDYARTIWTVVLSQEGIEIDGIKRRVFIYSENKIIDYGMIRSFLKAYTKFKYGIDIKSNKFIPTYDLIVALGDSYEMCILIYKFRKYL